VKIFRRKFYPQIATKKLTVFIFSSDEINRNRRKVMEINYFLDVQREKFDQITSMEIQNLVEI
jgi:hypothetical protein